MSESQPQRRWFHPTPAWLVFGTVAVTGLLFLSERWRWFSFNEKKGWTVLITVAGVGVVPLAMLLWWLVALVFRWRYQFEIRSLLATLEQLWLNINDTQVTHAGLTHIAGLTKLELLSLDGTQIADTALVQIAGLTELRWLFLKGTHVTAAGLAHLAGLTGLQVLSLDDTEVTDMGLTHLVGLTKLSSVSLEGTQVTYEGVENLQKALPNCTILR